MKRLFDLKTGRTLICHLFSPRDLSEAVSEAQGAASAGADAIAVELFQFRENFRNEKCFREIVDSVELPFMFLDYRNDRFGWDDERRMEMLMQAASAGAGMIDVVGDLFC
ncbi:MAG: hypothetical protein MJ016_07850, partial [Victivallaceae bacterium]|nr:hypothetical protein [Victivallaceae bacterium]